MDGWMDKYGDGQIFNDRWVKKYESMTVIS